MLPDQDLIRRDAHKLKKLRICGGYLKLNETVLMHEASILRSKYYSNRGRINTLNYSSFIARGTSVTPRTRKLCWRGRESDGKD